MAQPNNLRPSPGSKAIERYRADIFQLYIVERKTETEVRDILKIEFDLDVSPKVFKTKTRQWGYTKNIKRSDILKIMRDKELLDDDDGVDQEILLTFRERPINRERVLKHAQRVLPPALRSKFSSQLNQRSRLNQQISSAGSVTLSLPVFQSWRLPEKLLRDVDVLVKGSFESGRWSFNGGSQIIKSSAKPETQAFEVQSLHEFLGNLDNGCEAANAQDLILAGRHWQQAFMTLEVLVQGQYHDIIPNIIQKINDLSRQGKVDLAKLLKEHTVNCCKKYLTPDSPTFTLYNDLGSMDMLLMSGIEELLMRRFTELFDFYLGPLAYNSFVLVIDSARRRLLRSPWTTFEDCLPAISHLDATYGPSDRRVLDVIGMRTGILSQRKMFVEAETEAFLLIERADMIQNDRWQHFYHLTRGWYFLGCAQYMLKKSSMALASLRHCLWCERRLAEVDDFHMFGSEKATIANYLEELESVESNETPK